MSSSSARRGVGRPSSRARAQVALPGFVDLNAARGERRPLAPRDHPTPAERAISVRCPPMWTLTASCDTRSSSSELTPASASAASTRPCSSSVRGPLLRQKSHEIRIGAVFGATREIDQLGVRGAWAVSSASLAVATSPDSQYLWGRAPYSSRMTFARTRRSIEAWWHSVCSSLARSCPLRSLRRRPLRGRRRTR